MVNTILVLSKQGHVGFRMPRSTTSSFSVSLQLRKAKCFSLPILNAAARRHQIHDHGDDGHRLTPPRLPFNVSTGTRHLHGTGVGWLSSFQFQQIDKKTSCRSFASMSKSNNHKKDQRSKAKQDKGQSKYSPGQYILDDYMQKRENLAPYQVSGTWNNLWKEVQKSRKWERQNFWIDHKETLQTLVDQTIQSSVQFDGRSTATVTHSLVKLLDLTNSKNLGARESLWNALLHKTILHIKSDGFNAHDVSNLLWAYAKADGIKVDSRLLDALAKTALLCINVFIPRDFSNTAWSFATLNHKAPSLFDAIARAAQVQIDDFNPQDLSNMIMAYAKMNHASPELFDVIAKASIEHLDDFIPQDFSNTAWSFATLKHEAPFLFDAIASTAQVRIDDFKPQELSILAWAFATLNHEAPSLFDTIAKAAQVCIDDFKPQELSILAWAFATLNHEAPSLFDDIARAAQVRIDDFTPQNLSNTTWAFATMNHEAPSLFDDIARAAQVCLNDFNQQELANTAWSFAVFNLEPNLFTHPASPFAQKLLSTDPSKFTVEALRQLYQFQLWCQEQNGENWLSEEVGQRCLDAFVSQEDTTSRLQNDVMESLRTLQDMSHLEEEVQTKSGYSMDAVIVYQGNEIGVEVDGPFHFVGRSQSPNGGTMLKHRQVRALESWKLVSVPYWEWDRIDKGSNKERKDKKHRYLQNLLDEAVLGP